MKMTLRILGDRDAPPKSDARLEDATVVVEMTRVVANLRPEEKADLVRLLVEHVAASDFVEALEDADAPMVGETRVLSERGMILLDIFAERASRLGHLPDDSEPEWVAELAGDADRLQRLIVEGNVADALALLRSMVPDHQFLSPAAEAMLAAQRSLL